MFQDVKLPRTRSYNQKGIPLCLISFSSFVSILPLFILRRCHLHAIIHQFATTLERDLRNDTREGWFSPFQYSIIYLLIQAALQKKTAEPPICWRVCGADRPQIGVSQYAATYLYLYFFSHSLNIFHYSLLWPMRYIQNVKDMNSFILWLRLDCLHFGQWLPYWTAQAHSRETDAVSSYLSAL